MQRKFFKTVIRVVVLSEGSAYEFHSLEGVAHDTKYGDCLCSAGVTSVQELTCKQRARELKKHWSDP